MSGMWLCRASLRGLGQKGQHGFVPPMVQALAQLAPLETGEQKEPGQGTGSLGWGRAADVQRHGDLEMLR